MIEVGGGGKLSHRKATNKQRNDKTGKAKTKQNAKKCRKQNKLTESHIN